MFNCYTCSIVLFKIHKPTLLTAQLTFNCTDMRFRSVLDTQPDTAIGLQCRSSDLPVATVLFLIPLTSSRSFVFSFNSLSLHPGIETAIGLC